MNTQSCRYVFIVHAGASGKHTEGECTLYSSAQSVCEVRRETRVVDKGCRHPSRGAGTLCPPLWFLYAFQTHSVPNYKVCTRSPCARLNDESLVLSSISFFCPLGLFCVLGRSPPLARRSPQLPSLLQAWPHIGTRVLAHSCQSCSCRLTSRRCRCECPGLCL